MKVVVLEPLGISTEEEKMASENIVKQGHEVVFNRKRPSDENEVASVAGDADVVIIANMPFKKNYIEKCANMKFLSVAFAGVDHVDIDFCKEKGIVVSNAAGYSVNAVTELAFGLAISILRNIPKCDDRARNSGTKDGLIGTELFGKKFGVIGTGAIGSRVCAVAKAFGCTVYAYSRTEKDELKNQGVIYTSLEEIAENCDIISLHVPYNKNTDKIISADLINKMKKNAIIINTARGGVVDSAALADALNEGIIAGAGIDVLETEPPFDTNHPLINAKNTVITPHAAFASKEALYIRAQMVFDNIDFWQKGTPRNLCS